jgi:H+-translocating NAD(P) transhydrogenase subunit alpha
VFAVTTVVGVPKESLPGERRVAASIETVRKLTQRGLRVRIERGAGLSAGLRDEDFAEAGAEIVDSAYVGVNLLLKVRPPTLDEVARLEEGTLLVSLIQAERNPGLLEALRARKVSVLALEKIPRITRAQKMDVLSSMANIAGYRAVIEAGVHLQGFFGAQITAAGATEPTKVLIVGAGVAGLAALGAARALGADVRAFDTRAAAREQIESLGGKFLEVAIEEAGEGQGGYGKVMSPAFIEAEMALFRAQAKEVDVIITTALVPGAKAPLLIPKDVVECLKPGSVVVDMAAEQGGNCELTQPGQVVDYKGVKILGFTDLPSRMAITASRFFATNLWHLLGELLDKNGALVIDLNNDVVHPALVLHRGETPPPMPAKPAAPVKRVAPPPDAKPKQQEIMRATRTAWGTTVASFVAIVVLFLLGRFAPPSLLQHSTVFVLACFVGWQVVWAVTPALHTPLMSVTNAISGIIVIGGILQITVDALSPASLLGAIAVFFASINVAGGFLVTKRMLKMFRREAPKTGGH